MNKDINGLENYTKEKAEDPTAYGRIAPFIFLFKFCATSFSLFIIELYFTLYMYFLSKGGPLENQLC